MPQIEIEMVEESFSDKKHRRACHHSETAVFFQQIQRRVVVSRLCRLRLQVVYLAPPVGVVDLTHQSVQWISVTPTQTPTLAPPVGVVSHGSWGKQSNCFA